MAKRAAASAECSEAEPSSGDPSSSVSGDKRWNQLRKVRSVSPPACSVASDPQSWGRGRLRNNSGRLRNKVSERARSERPRSETLRNSGRLRNKGRNRPSQKQGLNKALSETKEAGSSPTREFFTESKKGKKEKSFKCRVLGSNPTSAAKKKRC